MGDRANIYVHEGEEPGVFFYTHWGGTKLPITLRTALQRKERWTDGSYLARIIFCQMVKGDEASATGAGISTQIQDNEYHILGVNTETSEVEVLKEEHIRKGVFVPIRRMSFAQFIELSDEEASDFHQVD